MITNGTASCGEHLRKDYNLVPPKEAAARASISVVEHLQQGVVVAPFSPEVFRQKLLRFLCICHIPFAILEQRAFRDLLLYSSPYLRGNDTLPKSGNSIKAALLAR